MKFERTPGGVLMPLKQQLLGCGRYEGRIIRNGLVIDEFAIDNLVVNQGLNSLLGVYFHGDAQITNWYVGLFSGNYTVLATDTAANIASAATEVTAYTAGARQAWTPAAAASQQITNSASQASFTFNAPVTCYGAFLISNSTIGGTTGTLFSGAQFSAAKLMASGDQLLLTYTYTAASA